ncbi:signal peptide peptidase SppA [Pedobacter sp. ISL-68]|uniref:signal peptide peptidase SppA n=1 Tax=unclassified Pedobacter TaxID=2628915 RepID=UPI001BE5C7AB|nr:MULTISPECIES: signal peptide peptidase SppA [unclassified Pedobacter]MBT2563212.1 signal peptide peptidase SppA [Pedobacter sp. ISL-64]MBT2591424.1 signal peptide peptidase SppA [Pedobacter sp. ISL-68]
MREFFKYLFASMLGFFLSIVIVFVICFVVVVGLISSIDSDKTVVVSNNSVLFLNLDQAITERTPKNPFGNLPIVGGEEKDGIGLNDFLKAVQKAKTDDNIKCIYLNVSSPNAGFATLREVRNALIDFKKSHKKIIAYSEVYTQGAYYLASVADKVYLNPEGALEFKGFSSELTFFKGTLEKVGVEMQVIRVGNYKSAVEPFILDKMSDYNRKQVTAYVGGLYNTFLTDIAQSRNIQKDSLYNIADNYKVQQPQDAVNFKMIDALKYKDQILEELKGLSGRTRGENIRSVTINDYAKNNTDTGEGKDKVAVIYANGEINGGEGSDNQIGSERISRAIRKARLDDNIKAVVLRVNSPGGSALASDVIWREIVLTRKEKPVIASFGDVAASGGYYIGCAADSIFVQPNTITGSIGVFGIIPNFQNLMTNKLGITFDGVKTGKYADIMATNRPMTAGERFIIQNELNRIYSGFVSRVADGRKKSKAYIDSIGGGHVWIGTDAVQIGLADRIGSFNDAIKAAAKKAKLKNYKVVEYPDVIDPWKSLMDEGTDRIKTYYTKQELGDNYMLYQQMKKVIASSGIQARMPFEAAIK